jgi:alpha/beta superfamily hydrolase
LSYIEAADHFFAGGLDELEAAVAQVAGVAGPF